MKQIYQTPQTRIMTVNVKHHLMEGSIQTSASPASVDSEGYYETLSRQGGSLWDEDEE